MKFMVGLMVMFALICGPLYLVWTWLNPTGFWERVIFLAVSIGPEFFMVTLAGMLFLAVLDA